MTDKNEILSSLQERAKELNCLYKIEELLTDYTIDLNENLQRIANVIPPGYQYPEICSVKIICHNNTLFSQNFSETEWMQETLITIQGNKEGCICVFYSEERPVCDEGPFLKEERKLLETIADRLGAYVFHYKLRKIFSEEKNDNAQESKPEWLTAINFIKETDSNLYKVIARKMVNYLCWRGISAAENLLYTNSIQNVREFDTEDIDNKPQEKLEIKEIHDEVYDIAAANLTNDEIFSKIQKWMQEERSSFLVRTIEDQGSTLSEIADTIRRFVETTPKDKDLSPVVQKGINASLIRRFLSDQLEFIGIAKDYVTIKDFHELIQKMIYPPKSHGRIGGKSVGLFIAQKILKNSETKSCILKNIKTPKTWYITSDMVIEFLHYNNLEEIIEQKYKEIDQIRQEYPYIVQIFKNSTFPHEIVKYLSVALDDFGNVPLIVRSSSLLEDRYGSAFSGKYKSLFVANQGSKSTRLNALMDAIAEVYASLFNADPIEYRKERGLLDYHEEMGIMIQEVVGSRVGKYFFPSYAGVAFSNNEFRWSPRIKREDGLIRLVPGLGTRAVDRLSDDYPILATPGKPGLKVNVTVDETIRYSPKKIDVINLETNTFETVELKTIIEKYGTSYPNLIDLVSLCGRDFVRDISQFDITAHHDDLVVTFDKLTNRSNFIPMMKSILDVLKEKLQTPVDIEFASDGKNFFLLQCRPQSYSPESMPAPIPKDIPAERIIFSANKFVSNGKVPEITHVVYVDAEEYNNISDLPRLKEVGKAVGKLNKILPKRQFILIGPGRWGSRGDIKLGVNVTYSDINNTSVLIEVARKKGNYLPDLSFGTHFFQDLVESSIRYLPLYPDDKDTVFNEIFFKKSDNILTEILPEYKDLKSVLHVIDVRKSCEGRILKLLMNADLDEALAYLLQPAEKKEEIQTLTYDEQVSEDFWRWRLRMAEKIASEINPDDSGVAAFYIFGSTKNATAGPASDIDILIHFTGNDKQRELLESWLVGWGQSLAEINYLKTGYKTGNLLDVHIITDTDIENKNSYAVKIGAVTDAAREIPLG
ncbi:MAG: PEP/pyruvate-binding domain-containing protein [Ignavibacteria bacterium]|nr:PEP/pyruvate-binding domain-containing protein [Ignavibacteria bacterium]